jgi:uncharacterized protein (TIGR03086 family)
MSTEILERATASTAAILSNVSPDQYDDATPCSEWTVRDLINHFIGALHYYAATGASGVAPDGGGGTDFTAGDVNAAYAEGVASALSAFSADGALERPMTLPFGEVPGQLAMTLAATDAFAHGWDLAVSTGQPTNLDPDLAEQMLATATSFLPDAMRSTDPGATFGPISDVADDAPAADRLAAFLGRRVG